MNRRCFSTINRLISVQLKTNASAKTAECFGYFSLRSLCGAGGAWFDVWLASLELSSVTADLQQHLRHSTKSNFSFCHPPASRSIVNSTKQFCENHKRHRGIYGNISFFAGTEAWKEWKKWKKWKKCLVNSQEREFCTHKHKFRQT